VSATKPVQQQFGVVLMKNLEKGAVTTSRQLPRCPHVFARFLQQNHAELLPTNQLGAASSIS
jgi:hypothetical protein